jgi:hypothetical protein
VAAALLGTVACSNDVAPGERYISPLDGQTSWNPEVPLVVRSEDMDLPPDYHLPELLRVVDLDQGGIIPGVTARDSELLVFTPDRPWPLNRRFAWVVDVPEPVPHGPELTFPPELEEPSVFDTSTRIDVLGGSVDGDDRACVVLSRMLSGEDGGTWRISFGETDIVGVVGYLVPRSEWGPDLEFPAGDQGVDVLCFDFGVNEPDPTEPAPIDAGEQVRLWWGGDRSWLITLSSGDILDEVNRLRRGVN